MFAKKPKNTKRFLIKFLVVGASGSGKTSLIQRFVKETFPPPEEAEAHTHAIGVDFTTKTCSINDSKVTLQIWDTTGEPETAFLNLGNCFFRGINVVLFCFDVSSPSLDELERWRRALVSRFPQMHRRTHVKLVALACKLDLIEPLTSPMRNDYIDDIELERDMWRDHFMQTESSRTNNDGGVTLLDSSMDDIPFTPVPQPTSPSVSCPEVAVWSQQHNMGHTSQCCAVSGYGLVGDESVFIQTAKVIIENMKKEPITPTAEQVVIIPDSGGDKPEWTTKDTERSNLHPHADISHSLAQLNLLPGGGDQLKHAESFQGPLGPQWQRDKDAPRCNGCQRGFNVFLRRHHCRRCGKIFCDACTANKGPVLEWGFHGQERQCDDCYQITLRGQQVYPDDSEDGHMMVRT